jgi:hypothetical protein
MKGETLMGEMPNKNSKGRNADDGKECVWGPYVIIGAVYSSRR